MEPSSKGGAWAAPRGGARRALRRLWAVALLLLAALGGAGTWGFLLLRGSLPVLDGAVSLPGLGGPVAVERDRLGVPTIRGGSRADVARATGFVHAQDRFFQMDLLRRRAAGELAELVGKVALPVDRRTRLHRFRRVAASALAALPPDQGALLRAYAEGVNAGLRALPRRPFEYLLLRADPAPWRAEDSFLVVHAMFVDLNGEEARHEVALAGLYGSAPRQIADLLAPVGTEWDAPLQGLPAPAGPLPGPEVLDLRREGAAPDPPPGPERPARGSNCWAVAGSHTVHGGAILADDMHLGLRVPNVWYRASLAWRDGPAERRITGVTLPGVPLVVVGSSGSVAWGFTNSYGDWQDLVVVETDPADPGRYLAPGGSRPFEREVEVLRARGQPDERLEVVSTIWGPVVDRDHLGRPRSLSWTAHHPEAVNLGLAGLERAATLEEALDAAGAAGIPPQNFVCADRAGRIGWTIAGAIPRRVGLDGRLPRSWADGARGWEGWLAPGEKPRIVDPPSGRIWTANARVLDGPALALLGDGGYALGARARQIRDDLLARDRVAERDMLDIQLDDRALFLDRWQRLLLETLSPAALAADRRRLEARRQVEAWGGRAAVGSVGYRLVRSFRVRATERALAPLAARARALEPRFDPQELTQSEDAVWRLVSERPPHLLDPRYPTWEALLLAALDEVLESLPGGGKDLAARTWGERNTAAIRHPLSSALPGMGLLLDMPAEALPGDGNMPRVQAPAFGASERLAVSPGREAEGYCHMPGGQSGHPLSPYYRAGHGSWARGEPAPFLPGPARHRLELVP
jgi:penicillin amidase